MNKFLTKGALGITTLLLSAVPALPSSLSFSFNNATSTAALNSSGQITGYSAVLTGISSTDGFSTTGTLNDTITWSLTGGLDVFTITAGTTNGFGVTSGTTLLQFSTSQSTGTATIASYGAVTSFTSLNSTFATDLFGTSTITSLSDSGNIKPSPYSNTLGLSGVSPTPEPATFLLFGAGLVGAAFITRRRTAKQVV